MKKHRIMIIKYPHDESLKDRLHTCLKMCCIPHIIIDNVICYEIYIDKGRCTWEQVMREVNRVKSVKFRFVNNQYIKDGQLYIDCGTIYC